MQFYLYTVIQMNINIFVWKYKFWLVKWAEKAMIWSMADRPTCHSNVLKYKGSSWYEKGGWASVCGNRCIRSQILLFSSLFYFKL